MTGERVSTSTIHEAARSGAPDEATRILTTGMVRLSAAQATRRAVLHVQAAGDPPVPEDLVSWYTGRRLHRYLARVRLPLTMPPRIASRSCACKNVQLDAASDCRC